MSVLHEQSIICHLLLSPENLNIIAPRLVPDHFSDKDCRTIYIYLLNNPNAELVTVTRELKGKANVMSMLSADEALPSSLPSYCDIIIKDYLLATSKTFLHDSLEDLNESHTTDGLIQGYEEQIDLLRNNTGSRKTVLDFDSESVFNKFIVDIDKPKRDDLIPFYLPTINKWLGRGIAPGSLVMLSGNAKDGKSTIALRQTWWLAEKVVRTAFISLEQRTNELVETMVGQMAKVSGVEIRNRSWQDNNKDRVKQAAKYLKQWGMYILGSDISTPDTLFSNIRMLAENGVKWFTIDHLQLIADMGIEGGYTYKIKEITRKLKLYAGQYGIVILLLAQNQEDSDRPKTWGSNVPDQDVDAWLVLARDKKEGDFVRLYRNRLPGGERGTVDIIWNRVSNRTEEMVDV